MSRRHPRFSFDPVAQQIVVHVGKVEFGQHIHTAYRQLVADALGVDASHITIAPVSTAHSPDDGLTVGSLSIQVTGVALQDAAAALLEDILHEATQTLGTPARLQDTTLIAETGQCPLFDLPLAQNAPAPPNPFVPPTDRPIAGLVRGAVPYIQDLTLPGLWHARALRDRSATASPGTQVITEGGFTALLSESEATLEAAWARAEPTPQPRDPSADGPIANWATNRRVTTRKTGETDAIDGTLTITASRPFLPHGSLAPACALAQEEDGILHIWTHSQGIFPLRDVIAADLRRAPDTVILHHVPSAGGYGHTAADDAAMDAALICTRAGGIPVRVTWPRVDEFHHAPVGAAMQAQITATLTAQGRIDQWRHTIHSAPHGQRPGGGGHPNVLAVIERDPARAQTTHTDLAENLGGGASRNAVPPYDIANFGATTHVIQDLPVRSSALRGLGCQINTVAIEAMMDALARETGTDPIAFRLAHLSDPRAAALLQSLQTTLAPIHPTLGPDESIGLAYGRYKNKAAMAAIAVRLRLADTVQVCDVWAHVDAGRVIDPSGALNQIEGGIIQAMGWTLCEGAWLRDGALDVQSWADYPTLGWADIPQIHAQISDEYSQTPPLGIGECMVGPVSAAIVNGVSALAGQTIADLPLSRERLISALAG